MEITALAAELRTGACRAAFYSRERLPLIETITSTDDESIVKDFYQSVGGNQRALGMLVGMARNADDFLALARMVARSAK